MSASATQGGHKNHLYSERWRRQNRGAEDSPSSSEVEYVEGYALTPPQTTRESAERCGLPSGVPGRKRILVYLESHRTLFCTYILKYWGGKAEFLGGRAIAALPQRCRPAPELAPSGESQHILFTHEKQTKKFGNFLFYC